jgi:hypothetical protein
MKRYLAFKYDTYYPLGGMHDFIGDFNTLRVARAASLEGGVSANQEVYDTETGMLFDAVSGKGVHVVNTIPEQKRETTIVWNMTDSEAACREGWNVFACTGVKEPYRLERYDSPDSSAPIFPDDRRVWQHVINKAYEGSTLHKKALRFINQESPSEYKHIAKAFPANIESARLTDDEKDRMVDAQIIDEQARANAEDGEG